MDTETKSPSKVKAKKNERKNEKKKKVETQDADITLKEESQQICELAEKMASDEASDTSTESEDFNEDVNAFNYNTITSLAALKDIIQGDNMDTPETDSFFQHYFMNHCNNLSSRNTNSNSPFPVPERRRLSQCREEDEDDERKESDLLCPSTSLQIETSIKTPENLEIMVKKLSFKDATPDQNANVVSDTPIGDCSKEPEGKEPPKRTVMGARHKFLVTTMTPPPPTISRVLRAQVNNAHTVHFGTKGAEEQRPNVRSIFAKQNLHHDKNYFDSSLIEIRSTVDGLPASSEDIWIKRSQDKVIPPKEEPVITPSEKSSKLKAEAKDVVVRSPGKEFEKPRSRSGTWSSATGTIPKEQLKKIPNPKEKDVRRASDERRQKREQRLDAAITRSTQSVGERKRRSSSDDGQPHPTYQQTIYATSGVNRRPALSEVEKSKMRSDAKKPQSFMQQVIAAVQSMTRSTKETQKVEPTKVASAQATPILNAKDGSAHPHSGSDTQYYHTITASPTRRPSAMAKVMELFRGRSSMPGQGSTDGAEKRKARAIAQQQKCASGIAKWSHIKEFYELDNINPNFVYAPVLKKDHLNPNTKQKMKVNLAAQVFSHSVAGGMYAMISRGDLHASAVVTADLVSKMDKLFDSLNSDSSDLRRGKPLATNLTNTSGHIHFFHEMKHLFLNLKFIGCPRTPPSQEGWVWTINAVEKLWANLVGSHNIRSLATRRLQQDPLENLFGCIRGNCGSNTNPTTAQFAAGLKTAILSNLSYIGTTGNCETDNNVIINNFETFLSGSRPVESATPESHIIESQLLENVSENEGEIQACAYVCGFIVKNIKNDCKNCRIALLSDTVESHHLFVESREYSEHKNSLKYVSRDMVTCVECSATIINEFLTNNWYKLNLKNIIIENLKHKIDFDFLNICTDHKEKNINDILNSVTIICLKRYCILKNRLFAEEASASALKRKMSIILHK